MTVQSDAFQISTAGDMQLFVSDLVNLTQIPDTITCCGIPAWVQLSTSGTIM